MFVATPTDPTLPPAHLKSLLPTPNTPWMISTPLFHRLQSDLNPAYRKCEILNTDPEWQFILQYFCAQKPTGKSISRAYCIHNAAQHIQFEANISTTEQQTKNPHFSPKWRKEDPDPLRERAIKRWNHLTDPYTPCTLPNTRKDVIHHTKIVPLWHGTKEAICQSICSTGFTTFGKHALIKGGADTQNTDLGYFGSGIYFTTSANYAATIYSDGNLLLAWVSMREPYPVVADKAHPSKPTDMKVLEGLGAYQNYNTHYIPVISIQPTNPQCAVYYPCTNTQNPSLDEIVVFNPSQALARFWIQLQAELLTTPTMTTFDHLLDHILELLGKETVQQNPELHAILEQKSKFLITLNLQDPLTSDDLTFYNCTLKLLDNAGKVRTIIHKQLTQIHTRQTPPASPSPVHIQPSPLQPNTKPIYPASPPTYTPSFTPITPVLPQPAPTLPTCAFGKAKWATYFGDIGAEPPLPSDINQILQGPCPIWSGKTVEQTHMLVLIPATVNGNPLTLKTLGELIQSPRTGSTTKYRYFDIGEYQDNPVNASYWALMTRDVLEDSRNKNYKNQCAQVAALAKKTGIQYAVPKVLEAATCVLMYHVSTGQKLYNDSPWTFTRCQEKYDEDYQLAVGGFSSAGLFVCDGIYDDDGVGLGVSRKFL